MSQPKHPKTSSGQSKNEEQRSADRRAVDQSESIGAEMVCVTLQRPPHFWRFACAAEDSRDLLETLADLADTEDSPLSWDDAELIASQIVLHHGGDKTQADPEHAR